MPTLIALALCLALPVQERPLPEVWKEQRLPNGLRVVSIEVAELADQAFVLVQPRGLVLDGPDEVQWAHLIEHVVLAVSDAHRETSRFGELRVNAETTQATLRFEAYAPPAMWEAALDMHATWLATRRAEDALLVEERGVLGDELRLSLEQGGTHKWAAAAWNQVVRHGRKRVALLGGLGDLDAAMVAEALAPSRLQLDEMVLLSVGPVDSELVIARLLEGLGVMGVGKSTTPAASLPVEEVREATDRVARWDLPVRHYMETFLVPEGDVEARVAADALALLLGARIQQLPSLAQRGIHISAAVDHITPEGVWLVLSSSLPEGETLASVRVVFRQLLADALKSPEVPEMLASMQRELAIWPDFPGIRAANAGHPGLVDVEVRQAVFLLYAELNMGVPLLDLLPSYRALDADVLQRVGSALFRPDNRASLLLEPED